MDISPTGLRGFGECGSARRPAFGTPGNRIGTQLSERVRGSVFR
ncbi:hypothetical protein BN903_68 [Halorubrum sp. AJ67]|nr:hypothetical protein BN903_68 [Halorubrum sp. AJ67]